MVFMEAANAGGGVTSQLILGVILRRPCITPLNFRRFSFPAPNRDPARSVPCASSTGARLAKCIHPGGPGGAEYTRRH